MKFPTDPLPAAFTDGTVARDAHPEAHTLANYAANVATAEAVAVGGVLDTIQYGNEQISSDANGDLSVTFPVPYGDIPAVTVLRVGATANYRGLFPVLVTPTGFTVRAISGATPTVNATISFCWIAIPATEETDP